MSLLLFCLVLGTSVVTYAVASRWLERSERATALRRLAAQQQSRPDPRRSAGVVLIDDVDPVRGRWAARALERLHLKQRAENLLETAALRWGAAGLLHRSVALFVCGFLAAALITGNRFPLLSLGAATLAGMTPLWYVRRTARRRVRAFEEQFADGLEFISRSMRAGHAFPVALEMVHREFSDPLASEFRRAFEEQNLGKPLEFVLRKMSQRIPSLDVQFFVSAVLLQRRTGGNLAELLDNLAQLIRERFKLRARIRAVSAQGLLSGRILSSIPVAVGILMFFMNRSYTSFFIDDPMGHNLLAAAITLQVIGYLIIRSIVNIED